MKVWLASTLLALSLTLLISAQDQKSRVGGIEFFGTAGIDVQNVRAHLPIQIGSEVDINSIDETKRRIRSQ
jgi:outer membrane protein assembly factor BamA